MNEQYDEVKARAKELLDKAKEEYNTLQQDERLCLFLMRPFKAVTDL